MPHQPIPTAAAYIPFILTNDPTIHALTTWRTYNEGALVEQRIELGQLAVGRTVVDDIGGNKLLWALGAVAYQFLHIARTTALSGSWRKAQPARVRSWLFRLPGKLTRHARKTYVVQRCDAGGASSIVVTLAHRLRQLRARLCRRCTRCEAADAVERATGRINN